MLKQLNIKVFDFYSHPKQLFSSLKNYNSLILNVLILDLEKPCKLIKS